MNESQNEEMVWGVTSKKYPGWAWMNHMQNQEMFSDFFHSH